MTRALTMLAWVVPATLVAACASFPIPTQRMADAEAAHAGAVAVGAPSQPAAELHVKLAEEQMAQAKVKMSAGDNREAASLLIRSKADSELALALAKEQEARVDLQRAVDQAKSTAVINAAQGAIK